MGVDRGNIQDGQTLERTAFSEWGRAPVSYEAVNIIAEILFASV